MRRITASLIISCVALAAGPAWAQAPSRDPDLSLAPSASAPTTPPTAEHIAAARRLIEQITPRAEYNRAMEVQVRTSMPMMLQGRGLTPEQTGRIATMLIEELQRDTYDHYAAALAPIYARRFTIAELRQIQTFYETPLGRRWGSTATEEAAAFQEVSARVAREIVLPRMIARLTELFADPRRLNP